MNKKIFLLLSILIWTIEMSGQWSLKTNLPTIYINTFDGKGITSKTTYVYAKMVYMDEESHITQWDTIQIRGRGNSTWGLNKKPYRIKFLKKQRLLGSEKANAKSWTLLANAADKTLIRNALASAYSEFSALPFSPSYKFVDLVLNDTYMGNYQISDQIDIKKKRVNIVEQDVPLAEDADISGGYLLEVDGFRDGNYFTTSVYNVPIRIHSPDEDEIVASQNQYIRDYINHFENRLRANTFSDAEKGYRAIVDSTTLVDWFLGTEITANIDGYYSTYFYKDQNDSLIYWGPMWDYDIAFNNDYRMQREQGLWTTAHSLMTDIGYGQTKLWINRMWQDPWFSRLVNRRYHELLDKGLVDYLYQKIDSLTQLLSRSIQLNYEKWGINQRTYHEIVLYSSYDQYVTDLKDFISEHCDYLKEAFADRRPPEPTPDFVPIEYFYRILNAKTAKAIDLSGTNVCQYSNIVNRETEDWIIIPANGYFQLINRSNGLALNDPTVGTSTPTTNIGTQLNVVQRDTTDTNQLWEIIPQGTEGYYNLLNVSTQHIANLNGGNSSDGTSILSYTNDYRNGESLNRLWYFIPTKEAIPEEYTGIKEHEPENYALAYNPTNQYLHFGADRREELNFVVYVYSVNGAKIGTFKADEEFSMLNQPSGTYIVTWRCGNKTRNVKFQKTN